MDAERQKRVDSINLFNEIREKRKKVAELENEIYRILHYMVFWPQGYNLRDPKTDERHNPKITFGPAPGHGSRAFTMTMTRGDLDQSHTFTFKLRSARRKASCNAPEHWPVIQRNSHTEDVSMEPHDFVVRHYSKCVIELIESDVEGLDVSEIPHESIVEVTKHYVKNCF